jgi:hypothetical protein
MAYTTTDDEVQEMMHRQGAALSAVGARLGELSRALAAGVDSTEWWGPARRAFDGSLEELRGDVTRAAGELLAAQDATKRALIELAGRVR